MADDVTIKFTADVSDLQQGMQQATSAVSDDQRVAQRRRTDQRHLRIAIASLREATRLPEITTAQTSSDTELAIARQNEQNRYDIALNGVKGQSSLVKEQAQTAQISRQEELSSLLALETQREDIERQHLQFVESTYQQGTVAYAAAQRRIEELASQSALRGKKPSAMSPSRSMPTTNAASTRDCSMPSCDHRHDHEPPVLATAAKKISTKFFPCSSIRVRWLSIIRLAG